MQKKMITLLAVAGLSAMAGSAVAGTITTAGTTPASLTALKIAKEEVEGNTAAAPLAIPAATVTTAVHGVIGAGPAFTAGIKLTPTDIPLTTLTDAVISLKLSAGKWTVTQAAGAEQFQICDALGGVAGIYKIGSGSDTIVFDKGIGTTLLGTSVAGTITNNTAYTIMTGTAAADCVAPVTNSITFTVPPGTSATGLTVKTGIASTQVVYDTATGNITAVADQLGATVKTGATFLIDYATTFKDLYDPATATGAKTSDTIVVDYTMPVKDVNATTGAGDLLTTTITVSDVAGLKTTGTASYVNTSADFVGTCADVNADKKIVCTTTAPGATTGFVAGAGVVDSSTFTINVANSASSPVSEKTFKVTSEYDFANATTKDRTVANADALLTNADGGQWKYRGTTIYVPLIKEGNGANTFIKLQAKENATVRGLVLCTDGTSKAVELGTITAGTPKAITSTNIVTALGSACTVDAAGGYAATLSITTDKTNVFGYANTVDGTGNAKRIPLSVESGVTN